MWTEERYNDHNELINKMEDTLAKQKDHLQVLGLSEEDIEAALQPTAFFIQGLKDEIPTDYKGD